jgi:LysM repeat protein
MFNPARSRPYSPAHAAPRRRSRSVGIWLIIVSVVGMFIAPVGALVHIVAPGEALWTIAPRYSVSVDDIAEANSLSDPDLVLIGQGLTIPVAPDVSQPSSRSTYTVVAGDSLWSIAVRRDVSLNGLFAANGIGTAAVIYPGQVLVLPGVEPIPEPANINYAVTAGDTLWKIAADHAVLLAALVSENGLDLESIIVPGQLLVIPGVTGEEQTAVPEVDVSDLPPELASDQDKLQLMPVFDRWALEYRVPPELMKSLAWFESGWNNDLVSSAGALGIGQILPVTADFVSDILIGEELDPQDHEDNIRISARYMRYLLDEAGDVRLAVASYYQGLRATREHGIYSSSQFYVDGILALRDRFD